MQLYALENGKLISHFNALKGINYQCPECSSFVRIKTGTYRHPHFFHLKPNRMCHLANKGEIHLFLQKYLKEILREEDPEMEKHFPSIGRVADIACMKTKKIFEVQYSAISLNEVKRRCQDYLSLGYQVIWILHDKRYNKRKASLAEQYLRATITTYFSDMNSLGKGEIYDQIEQIANHRRRGKSAPLPVNLKKSFLNSDEKFSWKLFHEGDSIDLILKGIVISSKKRPFSFSFFRKMKNFYLLALYKLLEMASK